MERYFDAFLYLANGGMRRLMIRLPRGLLDLGVAERYCTSDAASAWAAHDYVILSLSSEAEDECWEEGEGRLASIALVRSELAAGDLRLLYLAWLLLSVQADGEPLARADDVWHPDALAVAAFGPPPAPRPVPVRSDPRRRTSRPRSSANYLRTSPTLPQHAPPSLRPAEPGPWEQVKS